MYRVIQAGIFGNTEDGFRTGYDFALLDVNNEFETAEQAYDAAWEYLEHDDFLIGEVVDDKLVNVLTGHGKSLSGWEDSDYQAVANGLEIEWGTPMPSPIRFRAFYHGRMLDLFAVNPMDQTAPLIIHGSN